MKIALIGYGKMGQAIERVAGAIGHEISAIIDVHNPDEWKSEGFRKAGAAIEFTTPETAVDNFFRCFNAGIPVVSGTTGWLDRWEEVSKKCADKNRAFFYASNFSIGVNIFFSINKYLARIMNDFSEYEVGMKEIHHIHKKDAPSGTAITLAGGILRYLDRKSDWALGEGSAEELSIESVREGEVPGFHEICYESPADRIRISHEAKNREGFALGAVLAAEFIVGKKGVFGMSDMLNF